MLKIKYIRIEINAIDFDFEKIKQDLGIYKWLSSYKKYKKMKKILLILAALIFTNPLIGQDFKSFKLNEFVEVNFLKAPEISKKISNITNYSVVGQAAYYIVSIDETPKKNDVKLPTTDLTDFYNKFIAGRMAATEGEIILKTEFDLNNFKGVEIKYSTNLNPMLPKHRYSRVLFISGVILSFDYWPIEENKNTISNKHNFYNSIKLNCSNCLQ